MKNKKLTVRLTEKELNRYKETSSYFNKSLSQLVRNSLEEKTRLYELIQDIDSDEEDFEELNKFIEKNIGV